MHKWKNTKIEKDKKLCIKMCITGTLDQEGKRVTHCVKSVHTETRKKIRT